MQHSPAVWAQLPQELQRKVFSELKAKRTLLQLQLTCKAWRRAADESLYQNITFNLDSTGERDERLVATLELPNTQYRLFVKTLKLQRPMHIEPTKNYTVLLMKFLVICPNLVCVSNGGMALPWSEFYQIICTLRRDGHLQKVGDIGGYLSYENTLENYNNAVLEFASTLQKLTLPEPIFDTLVSNLKAVDAYALGNRLKEFKSLKELRIDFLVDWDLCRMDDLLDEIADSISHLEINSRETSTRFDRVEKFEPSLDGHRFAKLKSVVFSGMTVFTDQDMLYVMYKFPNVEILNVNFYHVALVPNLELETLQSASVVCKFMTYLMQQKPFCRMDHLITTSQIMNEIIIQLSEVSAVKKMKIYACASLNTEYTDLCFMGDLDPKAGYEIWLEVTMPSFTMEDLYQHTLDAFCQSLEHLCLFGKPATEEDDDYHWNYFSDMQRFQNELFKSSIGYILSNYSALKTLKLEKMVLMPFSSVKPSPKRELEKLEIDSCSLQPQILTQLSQRLKYVETMSILRVNWIPDDMDLGANDMRYTINMPFTEFGSIHLDTFGMVDDHLFKIWTSTTVVRFKFNRNEEVYEFLTEEEFEQYGQMTMPDPWFTIIFCASCNAIFVDSCEVLLPEDGDEESLNSDDGDEENSNNDDDEDEENLNSDDVAIN